MNSSSRDHAHAATGVREPVEAVSDTKDGYPSGRHMIDGFRMMATAARVSAGKHQKEMAEVYDLAARCIENEALRAGRAEARLAAAVLALAAQDDDIWSAMQNQEEDVRVNGPTHPGLLEPMRDILRDMHRRSRAALSLATASPSSPNVTDPGMTSENGLNQ